MQGMLHDRQQPTKEIWLQHQHQKKKKRRSRSRRRRRRRRRLFGWFGLRTRQGRHISIKRRLLCSEEAAVHPSPQLYARLLISDRQETHQVHFPHKRDAITDSFWSSCYIHISFFISFWISLHLVNKSISHYLPLCKYVWVHPFSDISLIFIDKIRKMNMNGASYCIYFWIQSYRNFGKSDIVWC